MRREAEVKLIKLRSPTFSLERRATNDEQRECINEGHKRKNTPMKERIRKELHVRVDPDVYAKLRQLTFYQRQSVNDVVNRLLVEYLEEKALEEPEFVSPPVL